MTAAFSSAAPRFQWDIVVAEFAEILRNSYWAEGSTLGAVLEEAQAVSQLLADDADVAEFVDLVRTANSLATD